MISRHRDKPIQDEALDLTSCLSCNTDFSANNPKGLCSACWESLHQESNKLAESMGWPAQAVYEHEILYLASTHEGPVRAEDLASRSRYTLRSIRRKLARLSSHGYARAEIDDEKGGMLYHFPKTDYPKKSYQRNMSVIRKYPASVMEESQERIAKICFVLAMILLGLFVLAFFGIPFPMLVFAFIIAIPITSIKIWKHRAQPEED